MFSSVFRTLNTACWCAFALISCRTIFGPRHHRYIIYPHHPSSFGSFLHDKKIVSLASIAQAYSVPTPAYSPSLTSLLLQSDRIHTTQRQSPPSIPSPSYTIVLISNKSTKFRLSSSCRPSQIPRHFKPGASPAKSRCQMS